MDKMDVGYLEHTRYSDREDITVFPKAAMNTRAQLATVLLEKWALVAGIPDGEDSAGRQKMRLPTPEELVDRACVIADEAVSAFERRGWLLELPEPKVRERKEQT